MMLRESALKTDEKIGFWKKIGICLKFGWKKTKDAAKEKPWSFWTAVIIFAIGGSMYIFGMVFTTGINTLLSIGWLLFAFIGLVIAMSKFKGFSVSSMLMLLLWTTLYGGLIGKSLLMPLTEIGGKSVFASIGTSVLMMALCFVVWMFLVKFDVDQIWSEYLKEEISKKS